MNAIECYHLTCDFGGVRALDCATLHVGSNEFVGVRGLNAAGKTTLLNAICGLVKSNGRVLLHGRDLNHHSPERRAQLGINRSFENGSICERLSIVDNVAMSLLSTSLAAARRRAEHWLGVVDAPVSRTQPGGTLSLGQKRRVELARLFARQEELTGRAIMLLDEPFRGLDTAGCEMILDLLVKFVRGKSPVLMVEHNVGLTERLATRVIWMQAGQVLPLPSSTPPTLLHPAPSVVAGKPVLLLQGVRAGYRSVEILHGVDLEIHEGEIVALKGRNGSGKSTLLNVIMGTLPSWSGRLTIFGCEYQRTTDRPAIAIGYAPQGARLINGLTVREHLAMAGEVAARRRTSENLGPAFQQAFPELFPLSDVPAGLLSSGQRSLVAMAMAMATEPRVLIADEPAAGLSSSLNTRLTAFLRDVWAGIGRTALIVDHGNIDRFDRIILLEKGRCVV